jgi:hypothetical protein
MDTTIGDHRSVLDDKSLEIVTPIIKRSRGRNVQLWKARGKRKNNTHLSWSEVVQSRLGDALKASLHQTTSQEAHTLSLI